MWSPSWGLETAKNSKLIAERYYENILRKIQKDFDSQMLAPSEDPSLRLFLNLKVSSYTNANSLANVWPPNLKLHNRADAITDILHEKSTNRYLVGSSTSKEWKGN